MLDTDHPQTKHVFSASALEDALLARVNQMQDLPKSGRAAALPECLHIIAKMRRLNQEHFDASPFIEAALSEAQTALEQLTQTGTPHDLEPVIRALVKLASAKGFGTCFI